MAARSTFTVHVKNLAGDMMHIPNMVPDTVIIQLKENIRIQLNIPPELIDSIVLTKIDSSGGFRVLDNAKSLIDYGIINNNNELNLVINTVDVSFRDTPYVFPTILNNVNNLDPIPGNTHVIEHITPDMVNKIIYIIPPVNVEQNGIPYGLQCRLIYIIPVPDRPSQIQVAVIRQPCLIKFITSFNGLIDALQNGRVRLLEESQGGRRKKRSRRTKRKLCRRRRTHRK
jgi:hypothetical protein